MLRPLGHPLPILCPACGSFTDRPPEVAEPEPGAVTLIEGTTDDDGKPYTVVGGKPIPRCPECDARLPEDDAPVCDRCGWNRAAGRKLPKIICADSSHLGIRLVPASAADRRSPFARR